MYTRRKAYIKGVDFTYDRFFHVEAYIYIYIYLLSVRALNCSRLKSALARLEKNMTKSNLSDLTARPLLYNKSTCVVAEEWPRIALLR